MTIDEAIKQFEYDAECNRADLDLSYAKDNEQVAEWLKLLKWYEQGMEDIPSESGVLPKDVYHAGYNKAIDDFVENISLEISESIIWGMLVNSHKDNSFNDTSDKIIDYVINTANEIAEQLKAGGEEYKGGWIPCNERLPEDDSICIVTVEYPNNKTMVDYGWFDRKGVCWFVGMQEFRTSNILAWKPLPEPFKERD